MFEPHTLDALTVRVQGRSRLSPAQRAWEKVLSRSLDSRLRSVLNAGAAVMTGRRREWLAFAVEDGDS